MTKQKLSISDKEPIEPELFAYTHTVIMISVFTLIHQSVVIVNISFLKHTSDMLL